MYSEVFCWKDKKGITITNAFQKIFDEFHRTPKNIYVEKGSEFCNRSVKLWLEDNDIEMCSTHNQGKYVAVERFIRTLKNKVYKYMTSILKNVFIDKLDVIINKYNNTYHSITKRNGLM